MIKLDLENLQKISATHGITANDLTPYQNRISDYIQKIESRNQGFYKIPDDTETIRKIEEFAANNSQKYSHIVILGIGGSALGTICIQQALSHLYKTPRLIVLDNIDPVMMKEAEEAIEIDKTLFIVISKSGGTPETLAQYAYFREKAKKENFVFITDPVRGLLRKIATEEDIPAFEIPENVGGRFSVLTPVGLLPAALLGFDIQKMISGAKKMKELFFSENFEQNLPYQIALIQYLLSIKGKNMTVLMPYAQKLFKFSDWYRQLLAESIGKDGIGLTPIPALGATDQHSQSQLYNDGPNDKLIVFIKVKNKGTDVQIPFNLPHSEELDYLKNLSFGKLIDTEMHGTALALTEKDRPNLTMEIEEINEETIGELFMFFEAKVAFLGELFEINAYDQPGVELSKQLTKQLLV